MYYPLYLFLLYRFMNHPNHIQKLKPEWMLNWAIIRILCNDFLCPPSQADWTLPSIHHSPKENQILPACTQSAPSHNLIKNHSNWGRSICTTPAHSHPVHNCPDMPSASTWAVHKYLHSDTARGHVACTWLLCTVCIWNEQVYFIFLFTGSGLETSRVPEAVAALTPSWKAFGPLSNTIPIYTGDPHGLLLGTSRNKQE